MCSSDLGRSVRNWLDRVRMRHAMRLFEAASEGRRLTKRDLVTIAAEDVRESRVFQAGSWGSADRPAREVEGSRSA